MDLMSLMRQAQEFKKNIEQAQADLEKTTVTGTAAGGLVSAEVNGKGTLRRIQIDRSIVNPDGVEMLEDLVVVAVAEAQRKAGEEEKAKMSMLGEGMNLPFKLPF